LALEKIKVLTDVSFVVVNVLMDPDHWETSVNWLSQIKTIKNVKINPMKVISNWAGATCEVAYTPEQEKLLIEEQPIFNFTESRYNELVQSHSWLKDLASIGTRKDGTEFEVSYSTIVRNKENVFTDWKCWAGKHAISIDDDGTTHWAHCGLKSFKHFSSVTLNDLDAEVICNRKSCDCGTDIKSPKEMI
jgi:hypothetical protein